MEKIILYTLLIGLFCNIPSFSIANSWMHYKNLMQSKLNDDSNIKETDKNNWMLASNLLAENKYATSDAAFNVYSFSVGINFAHYIPTNSAKELNLDTPPLNLGGEVLINYNISAHIGIISGFNYQYGKIALKHIYYGDRTIFHELSIPVLCDYRAFNLFKTNLRLKTGIYLGKYGKIKRETKGGKLSQVTNKWYNFPLKNNSKNFVCDYYLSVGNEPITSKNQIIFELFLKYRLNKHWLNDDVSKLMYGVKIIKRVKL